MIKPKPAKKPAASATSRVLPIELRVGDRLVGETAEWQVDRPAVHDRGRKDRTRARKEGRPT
jgi:hypothetical protein